jgi:hypothetical protein
MKLLNYEITFKHLIMLVAILYILMFIIKTKERFETEIESKDVQKQKSKACGQESVNSGYLHYVFNSPLVPRR